MLGKANNKGPGSLTNVDYFAELTDDGIHQVVALAREGRLDVYLTFRTFDGGVCAHVGAWLAPVSGTGECAWCGVYTAVEVGVYKNVLEV